MSGFRVITIPPRYGLTLQLAVCADVGCNVVRNFILILGLHIRNSLDYTDTPKSRKASFNEVFLSVDSFLFPIIKAHET
jgi:hypothetical protein